MSSENIEYIHVAYVKTHYFMLNCMKFSLVMKKMKQQRKKEMPVCDTETCHTQKENSVLCAVINKW